jgi:hypothetical protein
LPQLATDTATPRQQKIYSQLPVRRTDYSGSLVSTSPEGRALAYVEAARDTTSSTTVTKTVTVAKKMASRFGLAIS